jgi:hypothetical protein
MTDDPDRQQSERIPPAILHAGLQDDPDRLLVHNEFACVSVKLRDPGGRPRLRIEDLRTQQVVELDAIELECLAWATHADLASLLDPSLTRWPPENHLPREDSRDH